MGLTETQSLMQIEVPQAVFAMLPAAVTQLVVVLKDTAARVRSSCTPICCRNRADSARCTSTSCRRWWVAAVIYFVFCWLLSRLAEWLPEKMRQRTAAPTEAEAVAPIAIMDPSNINQIAVAKEVDEKMFTAGAGPRQYHVHHRGSNASIREWRRTRYMQGYDETHPESQIDPPTMEFPELFKAKPKDAKGSDSGTSGKSAKGGVTRICLVPVD